MRFRTLKELTELCVREQQTISEIMIADQVKESGMSRSDVMRQMSDYYVIMKEAVSKGMNEDTTSSSGLTGLDVQRVGKMLMQKETGLGAEAGKAMAYALPFPRSMHRWDGSSPPRQPVRAASYQAFSSARRQGSAGTMTG